MGPRTTGSSRKAHHPYYQCTNTHQTRSQPTIRARSRRITNCHRSNSLPKRSTSKTTRWHRKTRTTTTGRFSLPEIHHHRAKLPHLRPRIPRNHARSQTLVVLAQRNRNPCPSHHRSCQSPLLPRPKENRTTRRRVSPGKGAIQHHLGI